MNPRPSARARLAPIAVRAAALWVLAVTTVKLFWGSANDLPPFIRDHFFGPELNFNLSIAVELSCALVALYRPRAGFLPLSALMSVFIGVLVYLLTLGAKSCGCFGGAIAFPPWAMLAVDGALFGAMLLSRPLGAIEAKRVNYSVVAAAVIVAWAAPWLAVESATPFTPPADAAQGPWTLPAKLPRHVVLKPDTWVGKSIHEVELARWLDTRAANTDATWILYSPQCEHCAAYLRRLANGYAADPELYVFVRLSQTDDESKRLVDLMPPGEEVFLPPQIQWVITPPWELVLEGGMVRSATDHSRDE
jgi:hypothetical protein